MRITSFLIRCLGGAVLALAAQTGLAAFPDKPITLIVPFAPGGTTDLIGRLVAQHLGGKLGQPVVVENRAGAGGSIGTAAVAAAKPDGYTLGLATVSTHGINPVVYKKLPFDALKDFQPITNLAAVPNVMVATPKLGIKDMPALLERARKEPGKLSYASAGNGSVAHMMGELFQSASGTDLLHVPYKGSGQALTDTLAGQVQLMFDNLPSALPHIQSGKLHALAVASPERVASLPDVPTFAELDLEAVNDASWFGLVAPIGLPDDKLALLHQAVVQTLAEPAVQNRLEQLGASPIGDSPDAFARTIIRTQERNRELVRQAQIPPM